MSSTIEIGRLARLLAGSQVRVGRCSCWRLLFWDLELKVELMRSLLHCVEFSCNFEEESRVLVAVKRSCHRYCCCCCLVRIITRTRTRTFIHKDCATVRLLNKRGASGIHLAPHSQLLLLRLSLLPLSSSSSRSRNGTQALRHTDFIRVTSSCNAKMSSCFLSLSLFRSLIYPILPLLKPTLPLFMLLLCRINEATRANFLPEARRLVLAEAARFRWRVGPSWLSIEGSFGQVGARRMCKMKTTTTERLVK